MWNNVVPLNTDWLLQRPAMKEVVASSRSAPEYGNFYQNNNENNVSGQNNASTSNGARRYAVLSNEWMSAMGEELGMHSLPDPLLRRLAEDASYRLREVLHVRRASLASIFDLRSFVESFSLSEMRNEVETQPAEAPHCCRRQRRSSHAVRRGSCPRSSCSNPRVSFWGADFRTEGKIRQPFRNG